MKRPVLFAVALLLTSAPVLIAADVPPRPNIVFIMADDLGYGDLGCYGGQVIRTPRIDAMASEGTRFTHVYAGTSVCAPTRCVLMTGLHTGHAPIRANRELQPEGQMPLPAGYVTVPQVLKDAGYATGCIGKWGLGMFGSSGDPLKARLRSFLRLQLPASRSRVLHRLSVRRQSADRARRQDVLARSADGRCARLVA